MSTDKWVDWQTAWPSRPTYSLAHMGVTAQTKVLFHSSSEIAKDNIYAGLWTELHSVNKLHEKISKQILIVNCSKTKHDYCSYVEVCLLGKTTL